MDADKRHLKKIRIEKLEVGMFIVDMDRSWFKHPFLTAKKMITSQKQIEKLREYGVQEVYIDPERGQDAVADETVEVTPDPPVQVIDRVRNQDVMAGQAAEKSANPPAQTIVGFEEEKVLLQELPVPAAQTVGGFPSSKSEGHIILAKEIEMARVVQREAQIVIRDIMQDVRLGKNIESDRVKRVVNNMIDSIFANQAALASLTRIKDYDEYTFVHSINVCILCLTLGRHLNFSREELEQMGIGALLHDVGKMRIPPIS